MPPVNDATKLYSKHPIATNTNPNAAYTSGATINMPPGIQLLEPRAIPKYTIGMKMKPMSPYIAAMTFAV